MPWGPSPRGPGGVWACGHVGEVLWVEVQVLRAPAQGWARLLGRVEGKALGKRDSEAPGVSEDLLPRWEVASGRGSAPERL